MVERMEDVRYQQNTWKPHIDVICMNLWTLRLPHWPTGRRDHEHIFRRVGYDPCIRLTILIVQLRYR